MKTHIEYPDIFFKKYYSPYHIEMAPKILSIYYELVALLHPPKRLASDETVEFLPKHVPHVLKDHIGKIYLALIPVGR